MKTVTIPTKHYNKLVDLSDMSGETIQRILELAIEQYESSFFQKLKELPKSLND